MSQQSDSDQDQQPAIRTPWSPAQTLALTGAIAIILPLVNMVVALVMSGISVAFDPGFDQKQFYRELRRDGHYLTYASLAANLVTVWLVLRFIDLRQAVRWPTYLAVQVPTAGWAPAAVAGGALYLLLEKLSGALFERPEYPQFLIEVYASAEPILLFWLALALVAPVAEEVLFRGFLFVGLRHSWLGSSGAIVATSFLWTIIHLQYDFFDKLLIFVLGLYLGWLRSRFNSILPPIFIHVVVNIIALTGLVTHVE